MGDNDDLADHSQGLTELQTRPANLVLGLKLDPNELDTLSGDGGGSRIPLANGTAAAQPATRTGGLGQEANFSGWGGYSGVPGRGGTGSSGGLWTSPVGEGREERGGGKRIFAVTLVSVVLVLTTTADWRFG